MTPIRAEGDSCPDMTDSRVFLVESDKDDEGLLIKRTLEWAKAQMCDERWPFGVTISQVKVCYDLNTGRRLVGEADKLTIVGSDGKVRSYPELTPQQVLNIGAQYQQGCPGLHAFTRGLETPFQDAMRGGRRGM
jgi:hypothetical protein